VFTRPLPKTAYSGLYPTPRRKIGAAEEAEEEAKEEAGMMAAKEVVTVEEEEAAEEEDAIEAQDLSLLKIATITPTLLADSNRISPSTGVEIGKIPHANRAD
jgi:hypothetical protein